MIITKQKGKETRIIHHNVRLSGSGVLQGQKQFHPAFGISCEYHEGLDLHLHARHQSNIGHFLQPRVSGGVHDQVSEGVKFELEFQRKFLSIPILKKTHI